MMTYADAYPLTAIVLLLGVSWLCTAPWRWMGEVQVDGGALLVALVVTAWLTAAAWALCHL